MQGQLRFCKIKIYLFFYRTYARVNTKTPETLIHSKIKSGTNKKLKWLFEVQIKERSVVRLLVIATIVKIINTLLIVIQMTLTIFSRSLIFLIKVKN